MIVSGKLGILFNPDTVYAIENSDSKYDVIAENKDYTITIYENLSKTSVENIMKRITFQIECQEIKDDEANEKSPSTDQSTRTQTINKNIYLP